MRTSPSDLASCALVILNLTKFLRGLNLDPRDKKAGYIILKTAYDPKCDHALAFYCNSQAAIFSMMSTTRTLNCGRYRP